MAEDINMGMLQPELTDIQKLFVAMTSMNTAMNDLQTTVGHDHKILFEGNGEVPVVQQVRVNTEFIGGIKRFFWIVGGAILVQTVAFGAVAFALFLQVMPILQKLASGEIVIAHK